jgi:hypothetical protein
MLPINSQMPSSPATDRRSFIGPWLLDCSQRVTTQNPANVSPEAGAEENMDISRPASPPSGNALHYVPEAVIEEAFASVTQTDVHVNANCEGPSIAAMDIDADDEADVHLSPTVGPITTASAPLEPGLLVAPGVSAVPQPLNAPADVSASAAPGTTIDARLTSLDKAFVNLWVRNLSLEVSLLLTLDYRATSYVCKSRTARHSPTTRCSPTALMHLWLVSTQCRLTFTAPCVVRMRQTC